MPMHFTCPNCGAQSALPDDAVGSTQACPSCGKEVTVAIPATVVEKPAAKSGNNATTVAILLGCGMGGLVLLVCGGILVGLMLPAVQAAREAARRMQCTNNIKQIALALHNYHDVYGSFPPAYTVDEAGERLHSWRTLILPFIDQTSLYDQIALDEPWDSPANSLLATTAVETYRCPSSDEAFCSYVVLTGAHTIFPGEQPIGVRDVADGTSNTLLVVEVAGRMSSWMEPTDLSVDDMSELMIAETGDSSGGAISSFHPGGVNAAMADGSIRWLSNTSPSDLLRALTTRAGAEPLEYDALDGGY